MCGVGGWSVSGSVQSCMEVRVQVRRDGLGVRASCGS